MLKLAAFADEISPDLDEQVRVCRENGVTHFELRGVAGKNVLDFDPPLRDEIKRLEALELGIAPPPRSAFRKPEKMQTPTPLGPGGGGYDPAMRRGKRKGR